MKELLEAAHKILKRSSKSAEEIVEQAFGVDENGNARKSHWTLYKELNPNDNTAKLGALDLFRLMQVTGDVQPLALMAHMLGYMLVDKKSVHPDRPTWEAEHAQDTSDLGEMARLMDAGASPAKVHTQAMRACTNLLETAVRYERDKNIRQ